MNLAGIRIFFHHKSMVKGGRDTGIKSIQLRVAKGDSHVLFDFMCDGVDDFFEENGILQ